MPIPASKVMVRPLFLVRELSLSLSLSLSLYISLYIVCSGLHPFGPGVLSGTSGFVS